MNMNAALEQFVDLLRAIPGTGENADDLSDLFASQKDEAFLAALTWIVSQPRGVVERLGAIRKLIALPGPITVSLRELTGWR
jgi:hypothetical protein